MPALLRWVSVPVTCARTELPDRSHATVPGHWGLWLVGSRPPVPKVISGPFSVTDALAGPGPVEVGAAQKVVDKACAAWDVAANPAPEATMAMPAKASRPRE
jgi:hypothetical protein